MCRKIACGALRHALAKLGDPVGYFGDMEEYQALCDRLFDSDPDVVRYTTLFAVETYKETTKITPQIATAK